MKEVIVYPDNTACVDGKLLTPAESRELVRRFGLPDVRQPQYAEDIDTPMELRFGSTVVKAYYLPTLNNTKRRRSTMQRDAQIVQELQGIDEIRNKFRRSERVGEIAQRYGVERSTIYSLINTARRSQ